MPRTKKNGPGTEFPAEAKPMLEALEGLVPSAGSDSVLQFWQAGSSLKELREKYPSITSAMVEDEAHISTRNQRYCLAACDAFTCERLQALADLGMRWSTVRELASDSLTPKQRSLLVEKFEKECSEGPEADPKAARKAGRKANTRLRNELIAERNRHMRKSEKEGKKQETIRRVAKSLTSQSTKLQSALAEARRDFKSGSAAATTDVGDSLESDSAEALRTLDEALQELLLEAGEFLRQSGALTGKDVPPDTEG